MTTMGSQPLLRRLRTWLITGPPGHLYGALADLAELLASSARARLRTTRRAPRP